MTTQPECLPPPPPHPLLLPSLSLVSAPSSIPLTTVSIALLSALLLLSVPTHSRDPLPQLVHEVGSEGRPV